MEDNKEIIKTANITISKEKNKFSFVGELRIVEQSILIQIKKEIIEEYIKGKEITFDFSKLIACNSTSTQNFNQIFIEMNKLNLGTKINIVGNINSTWQKRSFHNFKPIYENIDVRWI